MNADGTITLPQFDALIRQHLAVFVQRQLAFGSLYEDEKKSFSTTQAIIQGIKLIILSQDQGSTSANSLGADGPQIPCSPATHNTAARGFASQSRMAFLTPHSLNTACAGCPEAHNDKGNSGTPKSVEHIWNQYEPPRGASVEDSTNARLDRLERVTLQLCDKVDQVLSRLEESSHAKPSTVGGLANLAEAPFRSANLLGLRRALGLGSGEGASGGGGGGCRAEGASGGGGGSGRGEGRSATLRDLLLPSNVNSGKVPVVSPRFRMPRTAEEAWKQKTEASLKRRARRSALEHSPLEHSPPAHAATFNDTLLPTTPRGGQGRKVTPGALSPGVTESQSSTTYPTARFHKEPRSSKEPLNLLHSHRNSASS